MTSLLYPETELQSPSFIGQHHISGLAVVDSDGALIEELLNNTRW